MGQSGFFSTRIGGLRRYQRRAIPWKRLLRGTSKNWLRRGAMRISLART
jgi:hypothetical protein